MSRLILLCLAALCSCADAQSPPTLPEITLHVQRATYKAGGDVTSPSWKVRAAVKNTAAMEWRFGEHLMLIETIEDTATAIASLGIDDVAFHVQRPRVKQTVAPSLSDRYVTLFGYDVDPDGTAIVPWMALSELAGQRATMSLFLATFSSPKLPVYDGGGFGLLAARGEAEISGELISPMGLKKRAATIVVLPSLVPATGENRAPRHVWYEFAAADVTEGDSLVSGVRQEMPLGAAALAAAARDPALPGWHRRLALNWLVEDHPDVAGPVVAELLQQSERKSLFRAAVANAGHLRAREAAPTLAAALSAETNRGLMLYMIEALGAIGDAGAAAPVRAHIDSKDESVRRAAIQALGRMKDTASVTRFMEVFRRSRDYQTATTIAKAVFAIDSELAAQELIAAMVNSRTAQAQRQALVDALDEALAQRFLSELSQLVLAPSTAGPVATSAAEALARAGTDAALLALQRAAQDGKDEVADGAIRAIVRHDRPVWRDSAIAIAGSATARYRHKALYYLGIFGVKAAAPVMRDAVSSPDTAVRRAACAAIDALKEEKPAACGP